MYCRAWLARYSDATCADPSVVLPWWCSASAVALSAMPRLCQGKENTCLAFFLHLCSHGLLGGGTEGPQFSCKRNVWCSSGGRGWMGEGWRVQNVFTPALLITVQEKPVALVFSVLWKHCQAAETAVSWFFFIGKTRLRWGMSRAQPFCQTPRAQHSSHCSRVQEREMLASSPVSPSRLCQVASCAQLGSSCHLLLC